MKKVNKTYHIKEVSANEEEKSFIGYASTPDEDRHGEIVPLEELKKTVGGTYPLLANHYWEVENTLGKVEVIEADEKGLKVKGTFSKNQNALEAYELVKMGAINKMSIGFMAEEIEGNIFNGVELLEVSLVAVPANNKAEITEVKNLKEKTMEEKEMEEQVVAALEELKTMIVDLTTKVDSLAESKAKEEKITEEEKELEDFKALLGLESESK